MKTKFFKHFIFWLTYSLQGTLLEYAWIHNSFPDARQAHAVLLAIVFNLVLLPGKTLMTYWLFHVFTNHGLKQPINLPLIFFEIITGLVLALFLHRLVSTYFIYPLLLTGQSVRFRDVFNISRIFVALLDTGYVAGIAVALKLFRMQIINLRKEKDLVKEKLETELKFLKNQINPHFLFNTLNNIYVLARKKSDQAPEIVLKLSKLLRFMLYESGKESISISEEIRILQDYVELEKIRYNHRLQLTFTKEVDNDNQCITPLILLPFIENAFKHGINETTGNIRIDIHLVLKNSHLTFMINNTQEYNGANQVTDKIGLSNVRRQLELMYREFTLHMDNLAECFKVNLQINLNSHATI